MQIGSKHFSFLNNYHLLYFANCSLNRFEYVSINQPEIKRFHFKYSELGIVITSGQDTKMQIRTYYTQGWRAKSHNAVSDWRDNAETNRCAPKSPFCFNQAL